MKKLIKIMIITMLAGVLVLSAACATVPQAASPNVDASPMGDVDVHILNDWPEFLNVSGTVVEVNSFYNNHGEIVGGKFFVLIDSHDDHHSRVNFFVDGDSVLLLNGDLEPGMVITGFYDTMAPAPLIYPPQFYARVLTDAAETVYVSRFDENFNSFENRLQLQIGDETEIVFQDGVQFTGDLMELVNRVLAVQVASFTESANSLVVAVPSRITILFEQAMHPTHDLTEGDFSVDHGGFQLSQEDLEAMWSSLFDPDTVQVFVNYVAIPMPKPFVDMQNGTIMVPAAYVAEAMGYNVQGEGADIVIGAGMTFVVGEDSYFIGRMAPMQLGHAPELHNGVLFVPIDFFTMVIQGWTYYFTEGNIFIVSIDMEDVFYFDFDDGFEWCGIEEFCPPNRPWDVHISLVFEEFLSVFSYLHEYEYHRQVPESPFDGDRLIIWADEPVSDFKVWEIMLMDTYEGIGFYSVRSELFALGDLPTGQALIINSFFGLGSFPASGISFVDANGDVRQYAIVQSQMDGDLPYFLVRAKFIFNE